MRDERPITSAAGAEPAKAAAQKSEFKVVEKREDGTVVLDLGDGRMTVAEVAEGVNDIRKGSMVAIAADGLEDGVPQNAKVIKLA